MRICLTDHGHRGTQSPDPKESLDIFGDLDIADPTTLPSETESPRAAVLALGTIEHGRRANVVAVSETRLILTCGLPGAGKTTLAQQLAADRDALRLTKDEWMWALGS